VSVVLSLDGWCHIVQEQSGNAKPTANGCRGSVS